VARTGEQNGTRKITKIYIKLQTLKKKRKYRETKDKMEPNSEEVEGSNLDVDDDDYHHHQLQ
jgi:hypothetical protein